MPDYQCGFCGVEITPDMNEYEAEFIKTYGLCSDCDSIRCPECGDLDPRMVPTFGCCNSCFNRRMEQENQ